jgi:Tol biopolymer transport system component
MRATRASTFGRILGGLAVSAGLIVVPVADSAAAGEVTERVNLKPTGTQSPLGTSSLFPSVSNDGTRVVFTSKASDLVPGDGDKGGINHVYMRDLKLDKTFLISVNSKGEPANRDSFDPVISGNGKVVAFTSEATNLNTAGPCGCPDLNDASDVYLRNLPTGTTMLVSTRPRDPDDPDDKFRPGKGRSWLPSISSDGHEVAFVSAATNLVRQQSFYDLNQQDDVFLFGWRRYSDGIHTSTALVSQSIRHRNATGDNVSGGLIPGPDVLGASVSGDGNCVAFGSLAQDLVIDRPDGNGVGSADVFVWCNTGQFDMRRVSATAAGEQGNYASFSPSLDADGDRVAFLSYATNLVPGDTNGGPDIFVKDVARDRNQISPIVRANLGTNDSQDTGGARFLGVRALSSDGSRVAFTTYGRLVPPTDCVTEQVYVRDIGAHTTDLVSVMVNGKCGDRFSDYASISGNGQFVVWTGAASRLVFKDTNAEQDVFVRGPYS